MSLHSDHSFPYEVRITTPKYNMASSDRIVQAFVKAAMPLVGEEALATALIGEVTKMIQSGHLGTSSHIQPAIDELVKRAQQALSHRRPDPFEGGTVPCDIEDGPGGSTFSPF